MYSRKIVFVFMLTAILSSFSLLALAAPGYLQEGDQGAEVKNVQLRLKAIGYRLRKAEGVFTAETTQAVKDYQKKNKLPTDGRVDEVTYQKLMGKKMPAEATTAVKPEVQKIISTAKSYIGVPYKFGGTTPKGFDCSGFVQYVFAKNGKQLPRSADIQFKQGKAVEQRNLQAGDVVFFTTYEPGASHCGIYLGDGSFIHASSSKGIMVSKLDNVYWKPRYFGARRIV